MERNIVLYTKGVTTHHLEEDHQPSHTTAYVTRGKRIWPVYDRKRHIRLYAQGVIRPIIDQPIPLPMSPEEGEFGNHKRVTPINLSKLIKFELPGRHDKIRTPPIIVPHSRGSCDDPSDRCTIRYLEEIIRSYTLIYPTGKEDSPYL
ncbi:hypothetical protein AVEN_18221-1 [Araneus ventricosus]|uniref:Uncharacterized protein n=1 Tax=Araneus ventricosus TaxID=182803 RepID=A0A4Y2AKA7_ARAVE|nr:hypothetical protein AVEN_18221-1 [Araneus ventricosus]